MARGSVVTYALGRAGYHRTHEGLTHAELARRVAELKGYLFQGEYAPEGPYERPLYFIPRDSTPLDEARTLGIHTLDDLYGGIVPHAFVKTKVITHGLEDEDSPGPRAGPRPSPGPWPRTCCPAPPPSPGATRGGRACGSSRTARCG